MTAPRAVGRYGPRVLAWSLVLGAAYGLVAGAASNLQFAFGLRAFGGAEYVPRVVGLSAVRNWGPWGAALIPALTAVVVLHRGASRADESAIEPRFPLFVGAAVLLLYPVVVTTGCFAALLVWCAGSEGTASAFVTALADGVLWIDLAWGAGKTVIQALLVTLGVRLAGASLLSRRLRLVPKLLLVWVALSAEAYVMGYLGRWFG